MQGRHETLRNLRCDGLRRDEAAAEVALQCVAQPGRVLCEERRIQAEALVNGGDRLIAGISTEDHTRRVAGDDVDNHEDDKGNTPDDDNRQE